MSNNLIPSLIDNTIKALSRLPGVGKKSAQRMVFHLLQKDHEAAITIGNLIPKLVTEIQQCTQCRHFTSLTTCEICLKRHTASHLCIVESSLDLIAIEQSGAFQGKYFVLHGILSPLDGIGPVELGMDILDTQLQSGTIEEVIIATNGSIDGQTTAHYLRTKIEQFPITITRLAQGIPLGGELEYTDSATVAQALYQRQAWQTQVYTD